MNDDLIAPLASETFTGRGAAASLTVPLSGASVTTSAGFSTLQIAYDAASQTYTLGTGGRQQSFRPQDIDSAQSSALLTTYVRTTGNTTDSLGLTATGVGAGQTRYVGGAFWQRQVNGSVNIDGYFDAVTYGIETAGNAVPRTGSASYDVQLLGSRSYSTLIWALGGDGRINVDFATGGMNGEGWYRETNLESGFVGSPTHWDMYAKLASQANSFAGWINLGPLAELQGRFYGPAAQEIGAAFQYRPDAQEALVGVLLGKEGSYPVNSGTSLEIVTADTFFDPLSASVAANVNGSGSVTSVVAAPALAAVLLEEDLIAPVSYSSSGRITVPGMRQVARELLGRGYLDYLRGVEELDTTDGTWFYDSYIYGFETPANLFPTTGTAGFNVVLRGGLVAPGATPDQLAGYGTLLANFATGAIETDGSYTIYDLTPAGLIEGGTPTSGAIDSGTWSGNAQISGSANAFSGTMTLSGGTTYSGTLDGLFYGPGTEEVGAAASLSGGQARIAAILYGNRSADVIGYAPLDQLTAETDLSGTAMAVFNPQNGRVSEYSGTPEITYDPIAKTYSMSVDYNLGTAFDAPFVLALGPGDIDGGIVEPGFTHYAKGEATGRILDSAGTNPVIELTYTTFAQFDAPVQDRGSALDVDHYLVFGLPTSPLRVPQSGSATYSGLAFGSGSKYNTGVVSGLLYKEVTVAGTSSMSYDFASDSFTATLDLTATGVDDGIAEAIGAFTFTGSGFDGFRDQFSGSSTSNAIFSGNYSGQFFGPNAEEFGAGWSIDVDQFDSHSSGVGAYSGVAFGKQD